MLPMELILVRIQAVEVFLIHMAIAKVIAGIQILINLMGIEVQVLTPPTF